MFFLFFFEAFAINGQYCLYVNSSSKCPESFKKIQYSGESEIKVNFQATSEDSNLAVHIYDNFGESYPIFKVGAFKGMNVDFISEGGFAKLNFEADPPKTITAVNIKLIVNNYNNFNSINGIDLNNSQITFDGTTKILLNIDNFNLLKSVVNLPSANDNVLTSSYLRTDIKSLSYITAFIRVANVAVIEDEIIAVTYAESSITYRTTEDTGIILFTFAKNVEVRVKGKDALTFSLIQNQVKKSVTYNIESQKDVIFDNSWNSLILGSEKTKINSNEVLKIKCNEKVKGCFNFPENAIIESNNVVITDNKICISNDKSLCGDYRYISFDDVININAESKSLDIKVFGGNEEHHPTLSKLFFTNKESVSIKSTGLVGIEFPKFVSGTLKIESEFLELAIEEDSKIHDMTFDAKRVMYLTSNKSIHFDVFRTFFDSDRTILYRSSGSEIYIRSDKKRNITLGETLNNVNFESKIYSLKGEATLLCADKIQGHHSVISHGDVIVNIDKSCYSADSSSNKVKFEQKEGKMKLVLPSDKLPKIFDVQKDISISCNESKSEEEEKGEMSMGLVILLVVLSVALVALITIAILFKYWSVKDQTPNVNNIVSEEETVQLNAVDTTLIPVD